MTPPLPLHKNNVKIKIRNHEKKIMPFYGEENVKISPIYHLSSLKQKYYSLVTSVTLRELTFARFSMSQCGFYDYP